MKSLPQYGFTFVHCFIACQHLLSFIFLHLFSGLFDLLALICLFAAGVLLFILQCLFKVIVLRLPSHSYPSLHVEPDIPFRMCVNWFPATDWITDVSRITFQSTCIVVLLYLVNNKIARLRFHGFYIATISK